MYKEGLLHFKTVPVYTIAMTNKTTENKKAGNGKKILIIEDEAALLRTLGDTFQEEGFEVLEAPTGEAGLEMALSAHPDIILLDLLLPGIGGIDVLKRLRDDAWGRHAEVILLTNIDRDMKVLADAVELGAYEYLVKSHWQLSDVIQKVKDKTGLAS